eukprot:scaffold2751_cov344-Prasinococcus_capsulatus_cf.AAC.9
MECARQQPLVEAYAAYDAAKGDLAAAKELAREVAGGDPDMEAMALEEITALQVGCAAGRRRCGRRSAAR